MAREGINRFQTVGIQRQLDASSRQDAKVAFHVSCSICMRRGDMDCRTCPIKAAHEQTLAVFDDLEEFDRMKRERERATTISKDNVVSLVQNRELI